MGSNLIAKELVAAGDFETISKNTAEVLQWIKEVGK
jgi:2-keto-3-deoxy-6-phosphogluconate aldolase